VSRRGRSALLSCFSMGSNGNGTARRARRSRNRKRNKDPVEVSCHVRLPLFLEPCLSSRGLPPLCLPHTAGDAGHKQVAAGWASAQGAELAGLLGPGGGAQGAASACVRQKQLGLKGMAGRQAQAGCVHWGRKRRKKSKREEERKRGEMTEKLPLVQEIDICPTIPICCLKSHKAD
jgi:hypothetical protein